MDEAEPWWKKAVEESDEEPEDPPLFVCTSHEKFNDSTRRPFVCKLDCRAEVQCEECVKKIGDCECDTCETDFAHFQHYKDLADYMDSALKNEESKEKRFIACPTCSLPLNESTRRPFVCNLDCKKGISCGICIKLRPSMYVIVRCPCRCGTDLQDYQPYKELQDEIRTRAALRETAIKKLLDGLEEEKNAIEETKTKVLARILEMSDECWKTGRFTDGLEEEVIRSERRKEELNGVVDRIENGDRALLIETRKRKAKSPLQ